MNCLKGKTVSTFLSVCHKRRHSLSLYFLSILIALLFLPATAAAEDHEDSTGKSADRESSLRSSSQEPLDQSRAVGPGSIESSESDSPSRWNVSVDVLIWNRAGGVNRTLVERVPGIVSFANVQRTPGAKVLNSTELQEGFSPGMKFGLLYHGDSGFGLELSYFQVEWWSSKSIGPDNPPQWLVMRAPGSFYQTQDFTYQSMAWDSSTKLYNAELNGRWDFNKRLTLLAGFRWLRLTDKLEGSLTPTDQIEPVWKVIPSMNLYDVARIQNLPGIPATGVLPPFWNTSTTNNLFGLQIGAEGKLFEYSRFSIGGRLKAGGYFNRAEESSGVSIFKIVRPSNAAANRVAFVGEAGLNCTYQMHRRLALRVGYDALWLTGVALAPGQIKKTYTTAPSTVSALGVNTDSGVLFHGATVGLVYSF
jgi:hypothetical protein